MTSKDQYKDELQTADTIRQVADGDDVEFWAGYMRGLRRGPDGDNFGTEAEHEVWFSIPADEPDLTRRARGMGYRAGLSMVSPIELFNDRKNDLTTKELANQAGVKPATIRQKASPVPGGRLTETGWRYPPSAVDYLASLPGRGRPKKKPE